MQPECSFNVLTHYTPVIVVVNSYPFSLHFGKHISPSEIMFDLSSLQIRYKSQKCVTPNLITGGQISEYEQAYRKGVE